MTNADRGPVGWLTAILDPVRARWSEKVEGSLVHALALLLDARFLEYQERQPTSGWPLFGTVPAPDAAPEERLVAALALQLTGSAESVPLLATVHDDERVDSEVRTVARVLASIGARDGGRPDYALGLWHGVPPEPLEATMSLIHRSLCERELGRDSDALETSLRAEATASGIDHSVEVRQGLAAVSARNAASLAFRVGRLDLFETRRGPALSSLLDAFESRVADSLDPLIGQDFEARFQDPGQMTMSFRNEDPVQTPMVAAVLRAEALGDWFIANSARSRFARHQLLASLGSKDRQPTPAFHLLRRANEHKHLRLAIRWYRSEGPLPPLREYGDGLAELNWWPSTIEADLVSLEETADVMSVGSANAALGRVLADTVAWHGPTINLGLGDAASRATAALLVMATPQLHVRAANVYKEILEHLEDEVRVQTMLPALEAIDWSQLSKAQLDWWYDFCLSNLSSADSRRLAASSLARRLPMTRRLAKHVEAGYRERRDLLSAVNILSLGKATRTQIREIAGVARRELKSVRESAAKGTHGFGGLVDAAGLLTQLLLENPGIPGWRDLTSFLTDPHVATSKRVRPLRRILDSNVRPPSSIGRRLAAWASATVRYPDLPMDPLDEFRALVLRARASYGVRTRDQLFADAVAMATSGERTSRFAIAGELPNLAQRISADACLAIALSLSRDAASEVRGAATSALAKLATMDSEISAMAWARVGEALADPGARVPGWAMSGMRTVPRKLWPASVRADLRLVRETHLSATLRALASELLA